VGFKRHIFSTLISLHSLLLCGAIFGYFYAWICPTPWGLDQIDPNTAITAMQAMNASVRNVVFAPVFFCHACGLAGQCPACIWLWQPPRCVVLPWQV
jgi:uncharacterized membrane protein